MTGAIVGATREEVDERVGRVTERSRMDRETFLARRGGVWPIGTVEEVAERLRALEAVGVTRFFFQHLDHRDLDAVALIGRELAPAVR
jgi:alkanesulfonate monooxygenase SsuD/methylene tetrahydromethanopterin reductase-like flavin-dependent oxidoreductase (luciferase family)